jgi:hypothetical protein
MRGGELTRRAISVPMSGSTRREMRAVINHMRSAQTVIRAIDTVTTEAQSAALRIKSNQMQLELALPAASPELNLITAAGCMALVRVVQNFGMDLS